MMRKITYLKSDPCNIGNMFIDLGSMVSLTKACESCTINHISGLPRILFENRYNYLKKKFFNVIPFGAVGRFMLGEEKYNNIKREIYGNVIKTDKSLQNYFDLGKYLKSDYAVISGCILCYQDIRRYMPTLLYLKEKNVKIIFNGVGSPTYSKGEVDKVISILEKIKPYALISRDSEAFKNYHDFAKYSYAGIDCAFFINDYFHPAELEISEYVVLTFDNQPEPQIEVGDKLIVRTSHDPLGDVHEYPIIKKARYDKKNILISDDPEDYLNIYANAKEVHTDRVHACVPTLSFGKPCRLYCETERALLFQKIGISDIKEKLTYPDISKIEIEKRKNVQKLPKNRIQKYYQI